MPVKTSTTPRSNRVKILGGIAVAIVLIIGLFSGCAATTANTAPDQVALHYKGGAIQARTFADCIGPSSGLTLDGPGDDHYYYPFGQRTFDFTGDQNAESGSITVVSQDNIQMKVRGVATFTLQTDCQTLRKFHERIGLKYGADLDDEEAGTRGDDGWQQMIGIYLKQPMDRAMDAASQRFPWKALYNDPETRQKWENEVGRLAPSFIREQSGGDYFKDIQLTIQKPEPPDSIVQALIAEQQAIAENNAQKKRNETVQTELRSIRDLVKVLGPNGYVLYKAVQDGKVDVLPVPQGGNVTVTPRGN
ncbi:MAG: hypothetical protein GEV11_02635 [Streptosporangiales bacterium]|nr:hypothetical protein [Streptosporangiales bacterium]